MTDTYVAASAPQVLDRATQPEIGRRAEIVLFALAVLMVPIVIVQVSSSDPSLLLAAEIANTVIWLAFALELVYLLAVAKDRGAVLRARWLDVAIVLLAPPFFVPPELASLRVLRLVRLVRLVAIAARLRGGGARLMGTEGLLYVGLIVLLVIFVGGIALYEMEPQTVPTLWEAFWFMLVTLTTVGYGDTTPKTFEGRAVASVAMVVGLGAFAALTAALAQTLFKPREPASDDLERRVADIEKRLGEKR